MENNNQHRVLAIVPDLFFAAKINETAKHVGASVEFARSERNFWARPPTPLR